MSDFLKFYSETNEGLDIPTDPMGSSLQSQWLEKRFEIFLFCQETRLKSEQVFQPKFLTAKENLPKRKSAKRRIYCMNNSMAKKTFPRMDRNIWTEILHCTLNIIKN